MTVEQGTRPAAAHLSSRFLLTPAAGGGPGISAFDINFEDQPKDSQVSSVRFHLKLSHPHLDQVTIWLAGGNREAVLWDGRGGSDAAGFDDAAGNDASITLDRVLNDELHGIPLSGRWTLYVSNGDPDAVGTLEEFWLLAAGAPPALEAEAIQPEATVDLIALQAYMTTSGGASPPGITPALGQSVYLDFSWQVTGAGGSVSVSFRALLDGGLYCSGSTTASNSTDITWCNTPWVATAGSHTLEWDLDYNNTVAETNESNNSAYDYFTVGTTVDIAAERAYLMTQAGNGSEVATPSAGQSVYFTVDWAVTGASGTLDVYMRAKLDGGTFCSFDALVGNGSWWSWCATPWVVTYGNHTLEWDLDYTNTIAETNENNNTAVAFYNIVPLVDIAAQTAYLKTGAGSGSTVIAPSAGQTVYLTVDWALTGASGTIDVTERALLDGGLFCSFDAVEGNGLYTSWCANAWVVTVGNHTLEWDLDYTNSIAESNENNNTAIAYYSVAAAVDIIAQRAYMLTGPGGGSEVATPTAGQSVYLTLDWQLTGASGSLNVSRRALLDGGLYCSATIASTNNIYTTWCNTPWVATAGSHTVEWDLDYTNSIAESNESNNTAYDYFTVPTLVTVDIAAQRAYMRTGAGGGSEVNPPSVGQAVYFTVDWALTGASGTIDVTERALLDGGLFCSFDAVEPNGLYTSWCVNPWVATAGSHTLEWDLDYTNSIAETNESNNTATEAFTVFQNLPPTAPVLVSPSNGATSVPVAPTLTWYAASGATSYDVYFGTSSVPPFVTNTAMTSYAPGTLFTTATYYWRIVAKNSYGSASSATWYFTTGVPPTGLRFVPVTPCRVADTRGGAGPFGGPIMTGGSTRSFAIPLSPCGIPGTALAYSLNVTVVPQGPLGYLSLWPAGQAQPLVSTLNSFGGIVVANAALVPAGSGGAVSVYVSNTTDVILDINGYFDTSTGATSYAFYPAAPSYYPSTPCRIVDTRGAIGQFGGPAMYGGQTRDFPIPFGPCGFPVTARAYSLNVTVVPDAGTLAYLSTWPTGVAQPLVSTLNSWTGKIVANAAIVPAGTNESISVYVTNPTDVILDGNGYFAAPGSPGALLFYPVTPCRVADTRNPNGPFGGPIMGGGSTRSFAIPASACAGVPSSALAYSLNVTVVPSGPLAYLTTWPAGSAQPVVSTLNSFDGSVVANAAIVPAGAGAAVNVFVTNPTHVILDINGYFAP